MGRSLALSSRKLIEHFASMEDAKTVSNDGAIFLLSGESHLLDQKAWSLMRASKAPSTWKKYQAEFKKFENWALERNLRSLPASVITVIRYLSWKSEGKAAGALATASAAISAFHKIRGLPSPCADSRVGALLEGARRTFSKPVTQKTPLTKEIIRDLWEQEVGSDMGGSILSWRNCWLVNLMFRTCARFADVRRLKRDNFRFEPSGLSVFFQFRKNDQRGNGHTIKILKSDSKWCFVKLTKLYFDKLANLRGKKKSPVIPKILRTRRKGELSVYPHVCATYNACRTEFYESLTRIDQDCDKFGLHSAKIGGVVHLRNAGISWRSINDHVGWAKNSVMPERYAKAACNETDKLDNILSLYD